MNLRRIIGGLVLFFTLAACANTSKDTNSLLWKISGNGLKTPSYLFGTHHLIPLSFLDSIAGLNEVFEATEQTVGELDMSKMNEMQMKIMGASIMPNEYNYQMLLSESDFQLLDKTLKELIGVGLDQLGRMKPAMLSNLISITLYQKYYPNLSGGKSIDQHFQDEAVKRSRPVKSLETAEEQIHTLLGSQTIERQAEMLACMVNYPEMLKTQMDKLQTAYLAQDLKALNALYEEELPDDPCPSTQEEKDVINKNRNIQWLQILPAIMQEKSSFIAVGCLHLVGKDGLIEGLRKLGYKVEAVK
ncbi:MAG: TraB family protein [Firmicutes bacterium ADurb.Bin419]|nr:MAG: TraB family protein [Firmicutes bacterium ADurb.Bin419]